MKKIAGSYILYSCSNFIEWFIIYTGARKIYLRGVISQNGKTAAF